MARKRLTDLTRRERQIMDVVFRRQEATVTDIRNGLADPPSYSAVRALVGILEEKGFLRHHRAGRKYVYTAAVSRDRARKSALRHVMKTFFDDSAERMVAALIDPTDAALSRPELDRLAQMIEKARKEGK